MDPLLKSSLKTQIEVYLQKFPNASTEDIKTWIHMGIYVPALQGSKRKTLNKFILYQKRKFHSTAVHVLSIVEVTVVHIIKANCSQSQDPCNQQQKTGLSERFQKGPGFLS